MDFEIEYITNTCICIKNCDVSDYIDNIYKKDFLFIKDEEYVFYQYRFKKNLLIGVVTNSSCKRKNFVFQITEINFKKHFNQIDFKLNGF